MEKNFGNYGLDVAIKTLRPNSSFIMTGKSFTAWNDPDGLPPPTWDEILVQINEDEQNAVKMEYARNRSKEYPYQKEQLDMLWHAVNSGIDLKDSEWFKTIKAVKDKYPKPE
jgi:hypothetical protein